MHKIPWNSEIQTYHTINAKQPDLEKIKCIRFPGTLGFKRITQLMLNNQT